MEFGKVGGGMGRDTRPSLGLAPPGPHGPRPETPEMGCRARTCGLNGRGRPWEFQRHMGQLGRVQTWWVYDLKWWWWWW